VKLLNNENTQLQTEITELETENKVLKNEFIHLQKMINDSPFFSKLLARANMTMPSVDLSYYNQNQDLAKDTLTSTNNTAVALFLAFMMNSFNNFFPSQVSPMQPSILEAPLMVAPAN